MRDCYRRAGYSIENTGYVEAHMTVTAAGDTIEAEAIARTFGNSRGETDPVIVGSVNTNLGHTGPVSSIAALIKAVFVLKHRVIPPNLNSEIANPNTPFKGWHLKVPTVATTWPQDRPLRVSICNFGYGGTNGHIILDLPSTNRDPIVGLDSDNHTDGHWSDTGDTNNRSFVYLLSAKDSTACTTILVASIILFVH
ncbi:thiolase-like protein [Trichoderma compactum]